MGTTKGQTRAVFAHVHGLFCTWVGAVLCSPFFRGAARQDQLITLAIRFIQSKGMCHTAGSALCIKLKMPQARIIWQFGDQERLRTRPEL